MRALPPERLPNTPLPGIRFQHMNFGGEQGVGTNIQIIAISKISFGGLKIEAIVRIGDSIIEDKSLKN